jgi:hypothetical protein
VCRVLNVSGRKRLSRLTSDELLRAILVMEIEGLGYREVISDNYNSRPCCLIRKCNPTE